MASASERRDCSRVRRAVMAALRSLKSATSSAGQAPDGQARNGHAAEHAVTVGASGRDQAAIRRTAVSSARSWVASGGSRSRSVMATTSLSRSESRHPRHAESAASGPAPGGGSIDVVGSGADPLADPGAPAQLGASSLVSCGSEAGQRRCDELDARVMRAGAWIESCERLGRCSTSPARIDPASARCAAAHLAPDRRVLQGGRARSRRPAPSGSSDEATRAWRDAPTLVDEHGLAQP